MTFTIYTDTAREYRWRLQATNGQIIATSGEGYLRKADCQHAIQLVKTGAPSATTNDDSMSQLRY